MNTIAPTPTRPTGIATAEGAILHSETRCYRLQGVTIAAQYVIELVLSFRDYFAGTNVEYTYKLQGTLQRPLVRAFYNVPTLPMPSPSLCMHARRLHSSMLTRLAVDVCV